MTTDSREEKICEYEGVVDGVVYSALCTVVCLPAMALWLLIIMVLCNNHLYTYTTAHKHQLLLFTPSNLHFEFTRS